VLGVYGIIELVAIGSITVIDTEEGILVFYTTTFEVSPGIVTTIELGNEVTNDLEITAG
jgi:hypothetical protein